MGTISSIPSITTKKILCEDGQYKVKTLILKSYNPGHPGYCGLDPQYCGYCRESHTMVVCPYKWYYDVKD